MLLNLQFNTMKVQQQVRMRTKLCRTWHFKQDESEQTASRFVYNSIKRNYRKISSSLNDSQYQCLHYFKNPNRLCLVSLSLSFFMIFNNLYSTAIVIVFTPTKFPNTISKYGFKSGISGSLLTIQ